MSNSAKAAAGAAMGSKAARACDGCMRRRARWYCAADDAFLCQGCDTSVHAANPLARRHERLRLRPASPPPLLQVTPSAGGAARRDEDVVPAAWFKRKARTPRSHAKSAVGQTLANRRLVVPEAATGWDSPEEQKGEGKVEEEEEELLYRVPIFDPALAEFCSPPPLDQNAAAAGSCCNDDDGAVDNPTKPAPATPASPPMQFFTDSQASFGPTDAELREFAADMEALLGQGLDDGSEEDSFYMETLGLIEPVMADDVDRVKVETDGDAMVTLPWGHEVELEPQDSGVMLDIDFDYGSPQATSDEKVGSSGTGADAPFLQSSLALNLNYEAIIESWGSSPWTDGERPEGPNVKLDGYSWHHNYSSAWLAAAGMGGHGEEQVLTPRLRMDGGREARVSRYREKRRTRLFSKKIRYEVRKLNAEKRPRMKGRFVKRTTAGGSATATACVG